MITDRITDPTFFCTVELREGVTYIASIANYGVWHTLEKKLQGARVLYKAPTNGTMEFSTEGLTLEELTLLNKAIVEARIQPKAVFTNDADWITMH